MSENMILKVKELLDLGFTHEQIAQMVGNKEEEPKKKKKKKDSIRKTYPIKDAKIFRAFLKELPPVHRLIVYIGVSTSLRVTDNLHIKVSDILNSEGKLALKEYVAQKTGKDLSIELNTYHDEIIELMNKLGLKDPEQYLFASGYGENGHLPMSRQAVWKMFKKAANKVGIKDRIGTHFMRKTFAYWFLLANPKHLGYLSQLLGHTSTETTLLYITATQDELQEMSDRGLELLKKGE